MILVAVLVGLAVLFAVAAVVAGRSRVMSDPIPDDADTRVPPPDIRMSPDDVDGLRFRMAFRGYRMDQVDDALDRLRSELAVRDARLAALESTRPPVPVPTPSPPVVAAAPIVAPPDQFVPVVPLVAATADEADEEAEADLGDEHEHVADDEGDDIEDAQIVDDDAEYADDEDDEDEDDEDEDEDDEDEDEDEDFYYDTDADETAAVVLGDPAAPDLPSGPAPEPYQPPAQPPAPRPVSPSGSEPVPGESALERLRRQRTQPPA